MRKSAGICLVAVGVAVASLVAAGCGGSTAENVTLHGTFTDLAGDFTAGQSCQTLETEADSGYYVTIAVDNIPAASVPVIWHGIAYATEGSRACDGTWTATVKPARVAYQIRMTGNDGFGFTGTDYVNPSDASRTIELSNAQ